MVTPKQDFVLWNNLESMLIVLFNVFNTFTSVWLLTSVVSMCFIKIFCPQSNRYYDSFDDVHFVHCRHLICTLRSPDAWRCTDVHTWAHRLCSVRGEAHIRNNQCNARRRVCIIMCVQLYTVHTLVIECTSSLLFMPTNQRHRSELVNVIFDSIQSFCIGLASYFRFHPIFL